MTRGKRTGQHRGMPLVGEAPTERYSITLPPEVAEALRTYGAGNLSAGIRKVAARLRSKT